MILWGECMYLLNDEKSAVSAIQNLLRNVGYDIKVDGIFGTETRRAVRDFQSVYGLIPSGRVDLETFEMLAFISGRNYEYKPVRIIPKMLEGGVFSPGDESNVITIIQAMLSELAVIYDFEPIRINGVFDSDTGNAIKQIQRNNLLPDDGIINSQTWNALVSEYEKYRE